MVNAESGVRRDCESQEPEPSATFRRRGSISGLRQRRNPRTGGVPSRASPGRGDVVDEFHQPVVVDDVVPFLAMPLPGSVLDVLAPLALRSRRCTPFKSCTHIQVDTVVAHEPGVREPAPRRHPTALFVSKDSLQGPSTLRDPWSQTVQKLQSELRSTLL